MLPNPKNDLRAFLMQYEIGGGLTIGSNENGDIILIVPDDNPDDPDADAYIVNDLQGTLEPAGGE